jgi:hypothetical protein
MGQSVSVKSKKSVVMDGITTTSSQGYSADGVSCSSGVRTSLERGWVRAFMAYGSNPYNGTYTITDDDGVQKAYRLEQCENTLRLRRLSDNVVVDTIDIGVSPDFSELPEVSTNVHWWLERVCTYHHWGCGSSTTTCTLCN